MKVRVREVPILTRAGVTLQPRQESELPSDEAYDLHLRGLVELLSSAPVREYAVSSPSEQRKLIYRVK